MGYVNAMNLHVLCYEVPKACDSGDVTRADAARLPVSMQRRSVNSAQGCRHGGPLLLTTAVAVSSASKL